MNEKSRDLFILGEPSEAKLDKYQLELFPSSLVSTCDEHNIPIELIQRLYDDGLLSFAPNEEDALTPPQREELLFLISLLKTGCEPPALSKLLNDLDPPYHYTGLLFDFSRCRWVSAIPATEKNAVDYALKSAAEEGDVESLVRMGKGAIDALSRLFSKLAKAENGKSATKPSGAVE